MAMRGFALLPIPCRARGSGSVQSEPSAFAVCPLSFTDILAHSRLALDRRGGKGGQEVSQRTIALRSIDVICEE